MEMERIIGKQLKPSEFAKLYFDFDAFPYQKQALDCTEMRVLLNWGRRAGKTKITAARGIYEALWNDNMLVLIVAPSLKQSKIVFDEIRGFLNTSRRKFPELKLHELIERENRLEVEFFNGSRIIALPGKPDTIRGYTAKFIIVDEASRVDEELYHAITPMLSTKDQFGRAGRLYLISTPFGVHNYFYRAYTEPKYGFKTFYVDSYANPTTDRNIIDLDKESMPTNMWEQEYLAKFIDETTSFFPISLIDSCVNDNIRREAPIEHSRYILAIDPASSGESESVFMILEIPASVETPKIVKIDEKKGISPVEIINYAAFLNRLWKFSKIMVDSTGHGTGFPSMMEEVFQYNPIIEPIVFTQKSKEEIYNHAKLLMESRGIQIPKSMKLRKQLNGMKFEYMQNYIKIYSDEPSDYSSAFVMAC